MRKREAAILKFSAPAIITSLELIEQHDNSSIWSEKMYGYLSADTTCSKMPTVFRELKE